MGIVAIVILQLLSVSIVLYKISKKLTTLLDQLKFFAKMWNEIYSKAAAAVHIN